MYNSDHVMASDSAECDECEWVPTHRGEDVLVSVLEE